MVQVILVNGVIGVGKHSEKICPGDSAKFASIEILSNSNKSKGNPVCYAADTSAKRSELITISD